MRTDLSSSAGAMARGAARGALGALIASVLALAFQAIVRHIVDIDTMGLFTLATTVVVLAQLPALFGLEAGAIRYVSLGASAGDERAARGAAQTALVAGIVLSTVAAGALYLLAPEICERFNKPGATHLLQLAVLALPLLCASRVCAACVLGFGLTGRSSTISAAQNLDAPARDGAARAAARRRHRTRRGLRDRRPGRDDLRDLAAAQRRPEDPRAGPRQLAAALDDRLLVAADAQPEPLPGHALDRRARARALRDGRAGRHLRPDRGACSPRSRSSRSRSRRPSRRASRARTLAATARRWRRCWGASRTGTSRSHCRSSAPWPFCASRSSRSSGAGTRPAPRRSSCSRSGSWC